MNGKFFAFEPHDDAGCFKQIFTCVLCLPLGAATMIADGNEASMY